LDGDTVGDALDEFHVVLDDDDGTPFGHELEQFRDPRALRDAHAGDRFVEHHQLRLLDQQHPDLEPLLLAVAQRFGEAIDLLFEKNRPRDVVHAFDDVRRALPEQRADDVAAARNRDFEVLENGKVLVDRRRLEFAANAPAYDLLLFEAGDLLVFELDRPAGHLGATADEVEDSCLAGPVRADDDAQLVLVDVEIERVDGLEPVERDRDVFEREQEIGAGGHGSSYSAGAGRAAGSG
jgi:hypothetical protein